MPLRVFAVALLVTIVAPAPVAVGDGGGAVTSDASAARTVPATTVTVPPDDTINEFLPEDRGIGECISALPKPGCGSTARGGWRQTVVFLAIIGGLAVIAWRIVAAARRARRERQQLSGHRTPDATSARSGRDGDRAP